MLGSNQRRLSRRFYSPLAPPESPPTDQHGRCSRRIIGLLPSAMRPWVPDFGAARATDGYGPAHGRARKRPRTGPVGAVTQTAPTRAPPRRERGKSDPIDALAVARAALREPNLPVAILDGPSRVVKLLSGQRSDLVAESGHCCAPGSAGT